VLAAVYPGFQRTGSTFYAVHFAVLEGLSEGENFGKGRGRTTVDQVEVLFVGEGGEVGEVDGGSVRRVGKVPGQNACFLVVRCVGAALQWWSGVRFEARILLIVQTNTHNDNHARPYPLCQSTAT